MGAFPRTDPSWIATVVYEGGRAWRRPLAVDPDEDWRLAPAPASAPVARPDEFVE